MGATERPAPQRLGAGDATAALVLSDEAGWNQTTDDWMVFLTSGTVFGLYDSAARLIATAALLPCPPAAWISMVLVTAAWRRRGLGTRLVETCIAEAADAGLTPWLDATPAGEAVYRQMGFHTMLALQRYRRQGTARTTPEPADEQRAQANHHDFLSRDLATTGFDRAMLLWDLFARPGSRLDRHGDAICLVRDGRKARQIGPLYADSSTAAIALLDHVLGEERGELIIDVIDNHPAVIDHLATRGFVVERPFRRMRFRGPAADLHPSAIAIAGPEFG